jgi:pyruvate dehydrogenase E2 component (dihydrolipoamide acetyltransferase)
MANLVKLPELGENLESGEVLSIKVAPGDTVSEGQTLLEIEAEKSTVEVPAPIAGQVKEVRAKQGDSVHVGDVICVIEPKGGETRAADSHARAGAAGDGYGQDVEAAGRIRETAPLAEAPPSRAVHAAPLERGPVIPPTKARTAAEPGPQPAEVVAPAEKEQAGSGFTRIDKLVPAGPATRRLARELGIDLRMLTGSAPGGRVTLDDVKAYVRQMAAGQSGPTVSGPAPALTDFSRWGAIDVRPLDPIRRRTAEHMSLAWRLIPHVTQCDEADITELDAFRRQQEAAGPKLTPTAFALKAAASALKQFPQFNASLDSAAGKLILKRYYHIGVAVDTEYGLLVPVLRDVDRRSVRELAQELAAVAERARQRKVPTEEMRGGTFTITNLGGIGGTGFSPIINYPEVAILGMSRARLEPVVRDGQIVPRLILPIAVSYDHRVIDGADAARFTSRIKEMLENPLQMLL